MRKIIFIIAFLYGCSQNPIPPKSRNGKYIDTTKRDSCFICKKINAETSIL